MPEEVDVIIVGAGVVGLTLAIALRACGLHCVVIEAGACPAAFDTKAPYTLRVSALTRASENLLRHLSVWEKLASARIAPYYHMQVWDECSTGAVNFSAQTVCQPNLGSIVENAHLIEALRAVLDAPHDNPVRVHYKTKADALHLSPSPCLTLASGEQLSASLVVGADGARSWLRTAAGFSVRTRGYQQSAIVATVKTEKKHGFSARQRFCQQGPLAFLPLADEQLCSIVWSQSTAQAKTVHALPPDAFNTLLAKTFEQRLGACELQGAAACFELVSRHANRYIKPGCVLVGDAAHSIHPLAGLGLNLGLLDVAELAEVLAHAKARGRPLGSLATLRVFERARRWHNGMVLGLMDCFVAGFGAHARVPGWLRGLGMQAVDSSTCLQTLLLKQALGLSGPLPRMAKASVS